MLGLFVALWVGTGSFLGALLLTVLLGIFFTPALVLFGVTLASVVLLVAGGAIIRRRRTRG